MFTHQILQPFFLLTLTTVLLLQANHCFCIPSVNDTKFFSQAVATWYDENGGFGSGGGCGIPNEVLPNSPYYGLTAAGNQNLYKGGKLCGACYQVKCTQNAQCSGSPITVTVTNECPGACNNEAFHFDLGEKAFGYLAKPGQADALRKLGRITVDYQRVPCYYKGTNIAFHVESGSNQYYLSFSVQNVNGDGDIGYLELLPSNSKTWIPMKQLPNVGARFETGIPQGINGPYSVRITASESRKQVVAYNVLPYNWAPGRYYQSNVNF